MALISGLDAAVSGLAVNTDRASVVSRNIAGGNDPNATRKTANVVTLDGGGARVVSVTRTTDSTLEALVQSSRSSRAREVEVVAALEEFHRLIGDPQDKSSPAAVIGELRDSLASFAAAPHDTAQARSTVATAQHAASNLNDAAGLVQGVRAKADTQIADSVTRLNALLSEFHSVNAAIIEGTRHGRDVTDSEDERSRILGDISEIIGIRTLTRTDNDMVVLTEGGLTLFEVSPRQVSFEATPTYEASLSGNPVIIDGIALSGSGTQRTTQTGQLAGLLEVRDELAPMVQSQLDEMARGLISLFAESDQTGGGAPVQAGLFTEAGSLVVPAVGGATGLAARLSVSENVVPELGGNPDLLRDGAISSPGNASYVYNSSGAAGFSDRLQELVDTFESPLTFDSAAGISTAATLIEFSVDAISWQQETRRTADELLTAATARFDHASTTLSQKTGVNLDEELTLMLDIERSYQATARLIASINSMFDAIFSAT